MILDNLNFSETHSFINWVYRMIIIILKCLVNTIKVFGPSIVSWSCHLALPGDHATMFIVVTWGACNRLSWSASSSHYTLLLNSGPRNFANTALTKMCILWGFAEKGVNLSTSAYSNPVSYNKPLMLIHLQVIQPLFHILLFVYHYFFPVMLTKILIWSLQPPQRKANINSCITPPEELLWKKWAL